MDGSSTLMMVVIAALTAVLAFMVVYVVNLRLSARAAGQKRAEAEKRLAEARANADSLAKEAIREAKELALREGREFDRDQREKTLELQKLEKRVQKREETLDKRTQQLDQREKDLKKKQDLVEREEKRAADALKAAEDAVHDIQSKLENVARLTVEDARQQLRESVEAEVRKSASGEIRRIEDEARRTADERARSIIATSIQRITNEFVADACVSVVSLPTDDMKGRIIGREGRNIRAIEQATGVDLIIDDTPEAVILSCFNPVRREIAKASIERLLQDGRIHPARIDEVVAKVTKEFDQMIKEAGERSAFECGVQGLHHELVTALGKLKYRTSGGQSILQHSVETSHIAGVMAAELELNVRVAKRAALLHDIGKSVDEESEGHHAGLGAKMAQEYGEIPEVVEAIEKHHQENMHGVSLVAVVVQAANALSGFRPGARKEFIEKSIGRLRDMESVVQNFKGVEQAFVIRSGKEVRAMVSPTIMDDEAVTLLAKNVARKLRTDLSFPGPVKVTMVRESRITELAK